MMKPTPAIVADFDEIADALAAIPADERLSPAEASLVRAIPIDARTGLDVGCGHGVLTRTAAARGRGLAMLGVDLSPRMIALARARTDSRLDVRYQVANVMDAALTPDAFDVVLSANMLHHLPLAEVVQRLARLVAPGGQLLLQDVLSRPGVRYLPVNVAAAAWRHVRRLQARDRYGGALRRLYARHGAGENYLTPSAAVDAFRSLLPGAQVIHHLEWRYSILWTRPAGGIGVR